MKKKFVIRYYWRSWVDIPVEAESEEEAFELSCEKYNQGEYEESHEDFENDGAEDVTKYYEENNIDI